MFRIVLMVFFLIVSIFNFTLSLNTFQSYVDLKSWEKDEIVNYFDWMDEMELLKKINFTFYTSLSDTINNYSIYNQIGKFTKTDAKYAYMKWKFLEIEEFKEEAEKIEKKKLKEKEEKEKKKVKNNI